jgi:hypothetical protein
MISQLLQESASGDGKGEHQNQRGTRKLFQLVTLPGERPAQREDQQSSIVIPVIGGEQADYHHRAEHKHF